VGGFQKIDKEDEEGIMEQIIKQPIYGCMKICYDLEKFNGISVLSLIILITCTNNLSVIIM
jgi:hypothetical protein